MVVCIRSRFRTSTDHGACKGKVNIILPQALVDELWPAECLRRQHGGFAKGAFLRLGRLLCDLVRPLGLLRGQRWRLATWRLACHVRGGLGAVTCASTGNLLSG